MTDESIRNYIVLGIVTDVAEFSDWKYASYHRNRSGILKLIRHRAARQGRVRYEPGYWFGYRLNPSQSKAFSRVLRNLEVEGIVVVELDAIGRAAWVSLTPTGTELAKQLADRNGSRRKGESEQQASN